jgi:hypothetical protein
LRAAKVLCATLKMADVQPTHRTVITLDIDLFHAVFSANLQNRVFMDWRDSNPIQRKGTLIIFMKRFQTSKLRISEAD